MDKSCFSKVFFCRRASSWYLSAKLVVESIRIVNGNKIMRQALTEDFQWKIFAREARDILCLHLSSIEGSICIAYYLDCFFYV